MLTAVQLRKHPNVTAQLVAGSPIRQLDQVALFGPEQLVAYMIEGVQHTLTLVFKTLHTADPLGAKLPGVHPRVSLLLEARGSLAASRLRNLFRYLSKRGLRPEDLSEDFWVRLDAVLSGQVRRGRGPHLPALLRHEKAA